MHKIDEENEEEKDDSQFRQSIESSFDYQAELDKLEKRRLEHEAKKARKQRAIN